MHECFITEKLSQYQISLMNNKYYRQQLSNFCKTALEFYLLFIVFKILMRAVDYLDEKPA